MKITTNKLLLAFAIALLTLNSCWSDEYNKTKEDEFITIQKIMFEDSNEQYRLQIRNSGDEKPLRWFSREQCSKYNTVRCDSNNITYVAYDLSTIISTFSSVSNKNVVVNSDVWENTYFYIIFENKDSLSWELRNSIILQKIIEVCNLQIDTVKIKVAVNNIKVCDSVVLRKYLSDELDKASMIKYSEPNFELTNTTVKQIVVSIDGLSKNRYQFIGSDTNRYSFNLVLESLDNGDMLNLALKGVGLCVIEGYEEISIMQIEDKQ